jgi:hypothetical protein
MDLGAMTQMRIGKPDPPVAARDPAEGGSQVDRSIITVLPKKWGYF